MGKKRSISDNNNTNIGDAFDLTLGRYEICELIDIGIINQKNIGLYRGNVRSIVRNCNGRNKEKWENLSLKTLTI